jgi:Na+-transporting methylmalonyl-CoA/oxaloacetate decarboxylase gamma subunit
MDKTTMIVLGVLAGLVVLIVILKAVRARQDRLYGEEEETVAAETVPAIANRAELAAVVASCVAEVMGKDVSGLRIVSIKQVG